jgi:hypothetical protein
VLVFVNDEGASTLAYRGTVTRGEWGFDARDIALGAREESSAFFHRTYYETAMRVAEKYGAKPSLVVGHSLGGNAAIRTVDKGLADRSISLNPFVRPSSIGSGDHTIYRHADDPALLSFENITRNERTTTLAIGQAGSNTDIHIIPRTDLRSTVDPVHAHSVDRFIGQPVSTTERTPLLGERPVAKTSRTTRVASSLAGAGAGIGVGALVGAAAAGLGVTDPYANARISGAFGNLAQDAIAVGIGSAAEASVALGAGAAGGLAFMGGYSAAKALGANDVVATGAGIATGAAGQAAVAQSIGIVTSAFTSGGTVAAEGIELGLIGAEVVGEGVALLGAEAAITGLSAFAAVDFWNPLGWAAAGLAASIGIGLGIAKLTERP